MALQGDELKYNSTLQPMKLIRNEDLIWRAILDNPTLSARGISALTGADELAVQSCIDRIGSGHPHQKVKPEEVWPSEESGARREKLHTQPYDLVPFQEITDAFVRVAEYGATKYDAWNWSKGLPRVQVLGSLLRHTFAYLRGEDYDSGPKGSGLLHTDHILWNAAVLCHNVHWNLADGRRPEPDRAYKRNKTGDTHAGVDEEEGSDNQVA